MPLFPSKFPTVTATVRRLFCSTSTAAGGGGGGGDKLGRIADELLALTPAEMDDYAALFRLKLRLSVSSFAGGGAGAPAAGEAAGGAEEAAVEKTAFDVKIEKFDAAAKIKIIKEVRAFTELGLKEAKELVEKAPVVVRTGLAKEEAEAIAAKLKAAGAAVVLE